MIWGILEQKDLELIESFLRIQFHFNFLVGKPIKPSTVWAPAVALLMEVTGGSGARYKYNCYHMLGFTILQKIMFKRSPCKFRLVLLAQSFHFEDLTKLSLFDSIKLKKCIYFFLVLQ